MKPHDKTCSDPAISITGKLPIEEWSLLTADQAAEVAALFQVLANDSRLRMLHALTRADEMCVGDLASAVGMTPQAASNQLRRLIDRRIVATRRDGNNILYRIIDPCVPGLLALGMCLAEETGLISGHTQATPHQGRKQTGASRRQTPQVRRRRGLRKA